MTTENTDLILIVEDDPQVARLISLILQRNGEESKIVADGSTALANARELLPKMIFADLSIKGMGGQALCSELKSDDSTAGIPFIVLSGDRDIEEKATACGADAFLGKPFEFDDLIALVKQYAVE